MVVPAEPGSGAAPVAPEPDRTGKVATAIREWMSFILSSVAMVVGVVVWFYSAIGSVEEGLEAKISAVQAGVQAGTVSKEVYQARLDGLNEKLGKTVSTDQLMLLQQQVNSLQRNFDSYVRQEGLSWAAVKKQNKEISDLVNQIQLTLARLTR